MNKKIFISVSLIVLLSFLIVSITVACKNAPEEIETIEPEITLTETIAETTPEVITPDRRGTRVY